MQFLHDQEALLARVVERYYEMANLTEKYWQRDNEAALKIQSKFKMYVKRKEFFRKKAAAIKIETHFRAHYARRQFKIRQAKQFNSKNHHYFSQQAVLIQKIFRGYYTRKHTNYYKRKHELAVLRRKNEDFKAELSAYAEAQKIQAQEYKEQLAKAQFQSLAKNLHHLSSTKGIPGVYNSPFVEKPRVFDKTVEEHLKEQFKSSYRWKAPTKAEINRFSLKTNTIVSSARQAVAK